MTRYEVLVIVNDIKYYLDTDDEQIFELNYNISDITDIGSVNSSYSKTITLPETGHNREVFGYISDLNAQSSFNPNLKTRCYVLVDSMINFEGYIQLRRVKKTPNKGYNKLECVIYGTNDNLFKGIGDKFLTDLDMSDFDHIWNVQSITQSWTADWQNGYFYGLIDYGWDWQYSDIINTSLPGPFGSLLPNPDRIRVNKLYPATYIKTIFNKILSEAGGYTYTSDFLDNNSTFNNLLMGFNRTGLSAGDIEDYKFAVQMSATQSYPTPNNSTVPVTSRVFLDDENDPNNLWDPTLYEYTSTNANINQRFYISYDLNVATKLFSPGHWGNINFTLRRSNNPNTGLPMVGGYPMPIYNGINVLDVISGNGTVPSFWNVSTVDGTYSRFTAQLPSDYLDGSDANHTPLALGENVWLQIYFLSLTSNTTIAPGGITINNVIMYNEMQNTGNDLPAFPGSIIDYSRSMPEKIKQKDFFLSVVKMFNLYIEPNKDINKNVFIEPRDAYYSSGEVLDWSQMQDISKDIVEDFTSDKQARYNILRYKEDKDILNKTYKSNWNANYGEYQFIFENEIIQGEKIIEPLFSPTPLVKPDGALEIVIPKIFPDGNSSNDASKITPHNPRVFQRNPSGIITLNSDRFNFEGVTYSYYPYVGHFDNPLTPTTDINFGQTKALYYNIGDGINIEGVNDNLYTTYWSKMLREINDMDSRFIKCYIFLQPVDIANFRFNSKVFIDGQYYRVNKIKGYNPSLSESIEVELIKARDITINTYDKTNNILGGYVNVGPIAKLPGSGVDNVINSRPTVVIGTGNTIGHGSGKNLVVGDSNIVGSPKSFVSGDRNTIPYNAPKMSIIGNDNTVDVGVENVTIIGDGYTAHESNRVVISSPFVLNPNKVDAGRDMVINQFQEIKVMNFISAGRDCVREIGSYDIVNIVSAGRDSVL